MYTPPRRERAEALLLKEGETQQEIAHYASSQGVAIPSQRRFLAAPDGNHVAFARDGDLVALDAKGNRASVSGAGGFDFRFRNQDYVVMARQAGNRQEVVELRLATGGVRPLATLGWVRWLEC